MFKAIREQKDGITRFRLSGKITEMTDLVSHLGELPDRVDIVCRELTQINSLGIKAWIEFFSQASKKNLMFTFSECPPPMVELLNYISGFNCGGLVLSVSLPFTCEACAQELRGVVRAEDLKRVSYKLPPVKCPKCSSKAHFDDDPQNYFAFLIRQHQRLAG